MPAASQEASSLTEAFRDAEVHLSLRYRFESVDQAGAVPAPVRRQLEEAEASTLRTTLSLATARYRGWSLFLEAENVLELGFEDRFNNAGAGSLGNGVVDRPVIADPEITEANQAYLSYARGGTRLDLGRREINLGDQRFVGNVGWRQNHQSFDSLFLTSEGLGRIDLTYLFIENVNRIFGDDKPMASHGLDLRIDVGFGALALYGLWLDYDEARDAALSTSTYGAELTGERPAGDRWKVVWEAEVAEQSDSADNPLSIAAGYRHAVLGLTSQPFTAKVGWELLEGSSEGVFRTPLATLHKWNGWADKFLATPGAGLEDLYLDLAGRAGPLGWRAIYHDFSADSTGIDYGSELDLLLTYKAPWGQTFGWKAAFYDADRFATDTDKIWLWTAYTF